MELYNSENQHTNSKIFAFRKSTSGNSSDRIPSFMYNGLISRKGDCYLMLSKRFVFQNFFS